MRSALPVEPCDGASRSKSHEPKQTRPSLPEAAARRGRQQPDTRAADDQHERRAARRLAPPRGPHRAPVVLSVAGRRILNQKVGFARVGLIGRVPKCCLADLTFGDASHHTVSVNLATGRNAGVAHSSHRMVDRSACATLMVDRTRDVGGGSSLE